MIVKARLGVKRRATTLAPETLTLLAITVMLVGRPANAANWSGEDLPTATPESQGMSPVKLAAIQERLAAKKTRAFLVVHNDHIVYEWYAPGVTATTKQGTASLAKALVGGLSLAVAITDGKISLDDPAAKFVPQWKDDPRKSRITIRHLGSHTSGLSDSTTENVKNEEQPGWMGDFWKRLDPPRDPFTLARDATPMLFAPGGQLQYSNPGIGMMTYCVTAAIRDGEHKDIRTLLRDRVLRPIGVADVDWSAGYGRTFVVDVLPLVGSWGGGAFTPRAVARIGRLVLRQGDWDVRRILGQEAVRQMTSDAGLPGDCGMGWWSNGGGRYARLPKDAVWGAGAGDQLLLVIPSLNLIMVRNGETLAPGPGEPPLRDDDVFTKYHDYRARILFEPVAEAVTNSLGRSSGQEAADLAKPIELPAQRALPDPLVMLDGRKVATREMWINERRPELIRLFQHYMYGQLPPKPTAVSGKVERVDAAAFGGKAALSEVTLTFGKPEIPPIHLMLVVPNQRTRPAPVVLAINYFGNHTLVRDQNVRLADNWMPERGQGVVNNRATEASRGSWAEIWRIEEVIDRGYALATFYNGDVDPDAPDQRGVQKFFQHQDPADDCGSIGAWAWGLERAVDYLVTTPDIDLRRILVTGHSRMGKAALLAAAFDERIALAIPHQAGCGGSAPSRARIAIGKPYNTLDTPQTKPPETVADINDKFPHWFNARFKEFNTQPERLPFDQHCLVALCAPRPVLFTNGRADTWINPAGQFEVLRAAAPVYRLLGAGDFTAEELPPDGRLIDGVLGFYLRPGGHSLLREDWKVFLDFADKQLGRP